MAHITQKCPLLCGGSVGTQSLIPPSSKQYAAVYACENVSRDRGASAQAFVLSPVVVIGLDGKDFVSEFL